MTYTSHIVIRIFCLLLMIHIVALNTCSDYYIKLLNKSSKSVILKNFDIEEEEESDTKTSEPDILDSLDDDYLVTSFLSFSIYSDAHTFDFSEDLYYHFPSIILPQLHFEIQIPPPRV